MNINPETKCMFCGVVGYVEHVSAFGDDAEHIKLNCCNNHILFSEDSDFVATIDNALEQAEAYIQDKKYLDDNISSLEECRSIIERIQFGLDRGEITIPKKDKMLLDDIQQEWEKL